MSLATILVVDDERIIAKGIEKRLKSIGYQVIGAAATGEEAIRSASALRPDLILMDIQLGKGMSGIEAAKVIREQSQIPVVFLTAHSDDATLAQAKFTEPSGYILKPYEDRDLQAAIEVGLYRHRMERRIRDSEAWLSATLSGIADGVIAVDIDGQIKFMNDVARRLTACEDRDVVSRSLHEVLPSAERCRLAADAKQTVAVGLPTAPESCGSYEIEGALAPIVDAKGLTTGSVLVFRDVTEQRRIDRELRETKTQLVKINAQLEMLATTDGLTNLRNRRVFDATFDEELKRARRTSQPLSLLLLDVDHFKQFNDSFGHPAGDEVLRNVAALLERTVRTTDLTSRYGGEEFAILLPNTDVQGAMTLAERVRTAIAETSWTLRPVTVSVGAATTLGAPDSAKTVLRDADDALYHSKRRGKNCASHSSAIATIPDFSASN